MKDAYYFPHDSNAKDDPKCVLMIEQMGLEAYGIYWVLIETLRDQPNYSYPILNLPALSRRYNTQLEKMKNVILNYGLFDMDRKDFFLSASLIRRMQHIDSKRKRLSEAGKYGNQIRWGSSGGDRVLIASKGKESKEKESKLLTSPDLTEKVLKHLFSEKAKLLKGSKPFTVTEERRKLIKKRLADGHGMPQFKAVADYKVSEWANTDMQKYLVPETLFSSKNFDKYLDQARDAFTSSKDLDPYRNGK